jgi:hypothetical protein
LNVENIIQKHQRMLVSYANKYSYLGFDNIYNECVMYLLEAYQQDKKPANYVDYWIRKYCENKKTFMTHLHVDFS